MASPNRDEDIRQLWRKVQFDPLLIKQQQLQMDFKWLLGICIFFQLYYKNPKNWSKQREDSFLFDETYLPLFHILMECNVFFPVRFFFWIVEMFLYTEISTETIIFVSSRLHSVSKIESTTKPTKINWNEKHCGERQRHRERYFSLYHRIAYVNFRFCYFCSSRYSLSLALYILFEFHKRTIKSLQANGKYFSKQFIWHLYQFISIHDSRALCRILLAFTAEK